MPQATLPFADLPLVVGLDFGEGSNPDDPADQRTLALIESVSIMPPKEFIPQEIPESILYRILILPQVTSELDFCLISHSY